MTNLHPELKLKNYEIIFYVVIFENIDFVIISVLKILYEIYHFKFSWIFFAYQKGLYEINKSFQNNVVFYL